VVADDLDVGDMNKGRKLRHLLRADGETRTPDPFVTRVLVSVQSLARVQRGCWRCW
jgi:hypothetical protein